MNPVEFDCMELRKAIQVIDSLHGEFLISETWFAYKTRDFKLNELKF